MEDYEFDSVWLQPVMVPHWVRGQKEVGRILNSRKMGTVELSVCALGGSVGTGPEGITAADLTRRLAAAPLRAVKFTLTGGEGLEVRCGAVSGQGTTNALLRDVRFLVALGLHTGGMTVDEAVMQMELLNKSFLLFNNAGTHRMRLTEDVHRVLPPPDLRPQRVLGAVSDEEDEILRIADVVLEVMPDAPAVAHAARSDDHGSRADTVECLGVLRVLGEAYADGQGGAVARGEQLAARLVEHLLVFQSDLRRPRGQRRRAQPPDALH